MSLLTETSYDDLSIDQIRSEIIKFKNDIVSQQLDNYYSIKSYCEILGISRRELSHSNFLAWLLNHQESHNLSTYPIKKFLEILVLSSNSLQSSKNKILFDSIITGDLVVNGLTVTTEKVIPTVGRIDIYIEADISYSGNDQHLRIVIENKVTSKEHSDQTVKYYNHFEGLDDEWINLYAFLTPLSGIELAELTEPECSCKRFIQTNYQYLVDYLLEPILNKDISDKTKLIINDYLQTLSQPTQNVDDEEHKQGQIMAIGNEERELLTKFWNKNQKLILSALYAISSDPDQDEDVRKKISSALDSISSNQKDRSLISIYYDGTLQADRIKKSDIGYCTVKILSDNNLIDSDIFNFLRDDKSCSFQLLKLKDEATETEIKYRKYRLNDDPEFVFNNKEYYVARNWGVGNIQKFINKIKLRFPLINYDIHE